MKLYIIRHAQSLGNIGQHRTPNDDLSPLGSKQAALIPKAFEGRSLTHIFCSPFRRVIQTATPLAKERQIPIVLIPELSEIFDCEVRRDYGWESPEDIEREFDNAHFSSHLGGRIQWWPTWPETETVEVRERVRRFIEREIKLLIETDAQVVVFGHGATTGQLKELICPGTVFTSHDNAVVFEYELSSKACFFVSATRDHLEENS